MERLTKRLRSGCVDFPFGNETVYKMLNRLAAYEDTGLTPEEVKALVPPSNEPLTLEELKKVAINLGEDWFPLWVEENYYARHWAFITDLYIDSIIPDEFGNVLILGIWIIDVSGNEKALFFEDYGETWIAYRRKPEGTA